MDDYSRFIACGDYHITDKRPKSRTDENYFSSVLKKINLIFDFAIKNNIKFIIQPGDFFDSHKASDFLKQTLIKILLAYKKEHGIQMLVIYGQHDQRFHSSIIENTPLMVLDRAGAVTIVYKDNPLTFGNITFYAASWNDEIQQPLDNNKINVLITHRMIIKDKLWKAQKEFTYGPNLFRKYPNYQFMITGDNHQSFTFTVNPKNKPAKHLINCGSLMRSTSAQTEHHPCVYLCDTNNSSITQYKLPILSSDLVMDLNKLEEEKRKLKELEEFITAIKEQTTDQLNTEMDFIKELKNVVSELSEDVANEINDILNSVGE